MPLFPIPINKGAFQNVDDVSLNSPEYAVTLRNLMINDGGANVGRPGLSVFTTIGVKAVKGLTFFSDYLIAITDDRRVWKIDADGIVTNITGALNLEGTDRPIFANDGDELVIAGGGEPKSWPGSSTTAALTGSPPDTKFVVYLDGYWILLLVDDDEIRWAGPTNTARQTFTSTNFFQAEGLPDQGKALAVLLRELYVFGETSTEIFQNLGDTSVPFRRSFFIDKGIAAPYSVVQADNTLWWLDSDRRIVQMQQRTPVIKSTPFDRIIRRFDTVDDCWGARIDIDGYYFIAWSFPTEERTFVYDYKTDYWGEWDTLVDGQSDRFRMDSYLYVPEWNRHFVGDPITGIIYELSIDNRTDGTAAQKRRLLRRSGFFDYGAGTRKKSNYYLFHVKRGVGTLGDTEPVFQVRVNDDDKGWGEPIDVGLGYPGSEQTPIRVNLRGIFRRRQLEISMSDDADFVLSKVEHDVEVLSS